ncbi:unnamed protein product [Heligmosomoides polygyrus]|uniref:Uncharacterized protein n=1 Tax=Heligmosomoides polygyrus TaxID=6339 RepID=A0A183GFD6_HELPZ|nr:unnamed protein product [Heligmosomoides polygyrus]
MTKQKKWRNEPEHGEEEEDVRHAPKLRAKGDTPAADHWRKLITMAAGSPAQRSADAHSSSDLNDRQLLRGGQKLVTEHVPYIEFQLDAIKSQTMSGISHPA